MRFKGDADVVFGSEFGLFDYDVRWHLGDRFTIVSDGAADFFGHGLRMVSGGVLLNRPSRGNAYLGVRSISAAGLAKIATVRNVMPHRAISDAACASASGSDGWRR